MTDRKTAPNCLPAFRPAESEAFSFCSRATFGNGGQFSARNARRQQAADRWLQAADCLAE